jgi:hypothetical protein
MSRPADDRGALALADRADGLHDRPMPSREPAMPGEGENLVPVSVPETLDFPIPPACEAGFGMNVRLLEQHWSVLRKAGDLIASGETAA